MSEAARKKFAKGYVNGRTRPVEINNVVYGSGKQAALALGISQQHVCKLIRLGRGRYLDIDFQSRRPAPLGLKHLSGSVAGGVSCARPSGADLPGEAPLPHFSPKVTDNVETLQPEG